MSRQRSGRQPAAPGSSVRTAATAVSSQVLEPIRARLVRRSPSPGRGVLVGHALITLLSLLLIVTGPATAQSGNPGQAFCDTNMAGTIQNIFMVIQFGGPLIGGVMALGATVALPYVRRSDWKQEMKSIRNQGVLWGVIVAPLGTEIVQFILNNIVVGGASCGF